MQARPLPSDFGYTVMDVDSKESWKRRRVDTMTTMPAISKSRERRLRTRKQEILLLGLCGLRRNKDGGSNEDLREYLTCLEADNGKVVWQRGFNDFLSDIVYERYAIGAPTVDSETGNIYLMTTAGEMVCVSPKGNIL